MAAVVGALAVSSRTQYLKMVVTDCQVMGALVSRQIWGLWVQSGVTMKLAQRPGESILLAFTYVVWGPACWHTVVAWRLTLALVIGAGFHGAVCS